METVIGLEVHVELLTQTKMYCSCTNKFGVQENTAVCPVCTGIPGTLPTINQKAVELAITAGLALNCTINKKFRMSRKNYFYPDLPKGYQISQFGIPICEKGFLKINNKTYGISDIHLEEDAGRAVDNGVDFNRCGIPLIEVVTEPCFTSAEQVSEFLKELRLIFIYAGVSDCRMEQGSMRCDVNVSLHKKGQPLGERCELKNISGFAAAVRAIRYEEARQKKIMENGGEIFRETRFWNDAEGKSVLIRSKDNTEDYRYFNEPDLPLITVSDELIEKIRSEMPLLPHRKVLEYIKLGVSEQMSLDIVNDPEKSMLFEKCAELGICSAKTAATLILGEVARYMNEKGVPLDETCMTCQRLCEIGRFREKGIISSAAVKPLFKAALESNKSINQLVTDLQLNQDSDRDSVMKTVADVLNQNKKTVVDYKNGRTNALSYLVGQCMKITKGRIDPALCKEYILREIEKE